MKGLSREPSWTAADGVKTAPVLFLVPVFSPGDDEARSCHCASPASSSSWPCVLFTRLQVLTGERARAVRAWVVCCLCADRNYQFIIFNLKIINFARKPLAYYRFTGDFFIFVINICTSCFKIVYVRVYLTDRLGD